jgi:AcrR family transcriptional regulator
MVKADIDNVRPLRKGERRKKQILQASLRLIKKRGFECLSVNDIADDIGISVGGLYRHIRTKTDLLVLACESINADSKNAILNAISARKTATEKLAAGMRVYWTYCYEHADLIRMTYLEFRCLPRDAQERYRDRETEIVGLFQDIIRAGVIMNEFRRVDDKIIATEIVFLSHISSFKKWALRAMDPKALLMEHIQLFLSRLRP